MHPGDESEFIATASYSTCEVFLKEFSNTRISHDSLIYQNGILVRETLAEENHKSVYLVRHYIKQRLFAKTVRLNDNNKYLLSTHFYSPGHFHWFCEVLPQLLCIKESCKDFILMLPDNNYVRTIGIESLSLLGLVFKDLLFMQRNEFYKSKKIYYINNCSKAGLNDDLMRKVQGVFIKDKPKGNKNIYITRENAAFRKVLNEAELIIMLKGYGFEIIRAEDFTLKEQVDIFTSAQTVIGIHGAGLANCIFMHSGSDVAELRKKENGPANVGFWHLAEGLKHNYYYYNGEADSERTIVGRGANLSINVKDFENTTLRKILTGS
jgi:capsular polysaccharide biosynthesis protein